MQTKHFSMQINFTFLFLWKHSCYVKYCSDWILTKAVTLVSSFFVFLTMNVHTNYKRPLSRFYNRCWSTIKKWKNITICIWSNCSIIIALVQKSIIVKSAIWTQSSGSRSMEEVDLVEKIQTVTVCFNKYHLSTSCLIFYGHSHITPKPPSPI